MDGKWWLCKKIHIIMLQGATLDCQWEQVRRRRRQRRPRRPVLCTWTGAASVLICSETLRILSIAAAVAPWNAVWSCFSSGKTLVSLAHWTELWKPYRTGPMWQTSTSLCKSSSLSSTCSASFLKSFSSLLSVATPAARQSPKPLIAISSYVASTPSW